jgi:hypothetical protein
LFRKAFKFQTGIIALLIIQLLSTWGFGVLGFWGLGFRV